MTFTLIDHNRGREREFDTEEEAEEVRNNQIGLGANPEDLEIVDNTPDDAKSDGGQTTEVVTQSPEEPPQTAEAEPTEVINSPEALSQDPIAWLESHNNDFVNTIKGTPAISKQGFRFIQAQFGITTESEVVEVLDDPVGVIVWAKAELHDGQAAEAHGEGYLTERDVDDNEFARYADTRAKNRAISDLTSAGALAVSEVSKDL